jgi:hypothetical protein
MDQGHSRTCGDMGVHAVLKPQIKDRKSGHGADHYANHQRRVARGTLKILCNNRSMCGTFPAVEQPPDAKLLAREG